MASIMCQSGPSSSRKSSSSSKGHTEIIAKESIVLNGSIVEESPNMITAREFQQSPSLDDQEQTLNLNLNGTVFTVLRENLLRYPRTRLGKLAGSKHEDRIPLCTMYLADRHQYYFDRSAVLFDAILNLYRNHTMHIAENACVQAFIAELAYWEIDHSYMSKCCQTRLILCGLISEHCFKRSRSQLDTLAPDGFSSDGGMPSTDRRGAITKSGRRQSKSERARKIVWEILEDPASSWIALVFMLISCLFIFTTIVGLVLSSIPYFRPIDPQTNETIAEPAFEIADTVCVAWFSFEYVARLWATHDRCRYIWSPMPIIDLLAILPFYFELVLSAIGVQSKSFEDLRRSLVVVRILRVLRVLRVLRILKVARYSRGFKSMGETLKRSWRELALLVMFILTTNLLFSTTMYFIECDAKGTHFDSIPAASWWCIITMTTVGYGDVYPITVLGKILASMVSISGIVLLAFPISVIVDNFHQAYYEEKEVATGRANGEDDPQPDPAGRDSIGCSFTNAAPFLISGIDDLTSRKPSMELPLCKRSSRASLWSTGVLRRR